MNNRYTDSNPTLMQFNEVECRVCSVRACPRKDVLPNVQEGLCMYMAILSLTQSNRLLLTRTCESREALKTNTLQTEWMQSGLKGSSPARKMTMRMNTPSFGPNRTSRIPQYSVWKRSRVFCFSRVLSVCKQKVHGSSN